MEGDKKIKKNGPFRQKKGQLFYSQTKAPKLGLFVPLYFCRPSESVGNISPFNQNESSPELQGLLSLYLLVYKSLLYNSPNFPSSFTKTKINSLL